MPDLSELTLEHFSGHVDEAFELRGTGDDPAGPALEIKLIQAVSLGDPPYEGQRAPFSLVWGGPADAIVPQGIYRLGHEQLGTLELFIVPLEPKPDGARYQAIFS
jgi:hypothetical protein